MRTLVFVALALVPAQALAASFGLDASTSDGVVGSVVVGATDVESAKLDLSDADNPALTATFKAPPDDNDVAHSFAFGVDGTDLRKIVATCGRDTTVLYPLDEGDTASLSSDCVASVDLEVSFEDGSQLDLTIDIRGESESGTVTPGSAVGFNPQPEPPGRPFQLTLVWSFSDDVIGSYVSIADGRLHPPEPGKPASVSWE